jgi:hypothetical protein
MTLPSAVRPLPRPIRPYPDETTASFLRRLENANALIPGQLRHALRSRGAPWLNTLSTWSGHDPDVLSLAMPQLRGDRDHHIPDSVLAGRPKRTIRGIACRRCAQARSMGANIEIYTTHDKVICPAHGLWIGEGTNSCADQLPLHECPEIMAAWRHHRNLITRLGRARVRTAWRAASWINWRWYQQARQPPAFRLRHRILTKNDRIPQKQAATAAALYLPTAALASVIASPYWEEIAHSRHPQPFLDRIGDEVTEGWLPPQGIYDPLRQWMLEDRTDNLASDLMSPPGSGSQLHDSLPCDN